MAALLPFAAMGAFAVYSNRTTSPHNAPYDADQRLSEEHETVVTQFGISSAMEYALKDRRYLQGGLINDGVGVDNSISEQMDNPNFDPVAFLGREQVELSAFDRWDTELSMSLQQSQIIPRRNNQQLVALSEEIRHPDDPSSHSAMYVGKFSPAYANARQVLEADRKIRDYTESAHEKSLRAWNGSQFFERAAGQSFRYSED